MDTEDSFDSVWDRVTDASAPPAEPEPDEHGEDPDVHVGAPVALTVVLRADKVPVAPWAQGWRIAAGGPVDGHVTMHFEHDVLDSPVAQLSAVTGLLGTIRQAKLDVAWWAIAMRGPLPGQDEQPPDFEQQLSDYLSNPDAQQE